MIPKKRHIQKLLLLLAFVAIGFFSYAQDFISNQKYIITKRMISMEDGLPSRMILDAIQDRYGFMWFATANGLCRYDGHFFKIYNTQNAPFSTNAITRLAMDSKNNLFIQSTLNYGSTNPMNSYRVLDLNTYQFKKVNEVLPNMPFKEDELKLMSHDELGSIFFATDKPCKIWQYTLSSSFVLRANLTKTNTGDISESQLQSRMNTINDCIVYYDNQNQCYLIRGNWAPLLINSTQKTAGVLGDKQFIFYDDSLKTYLTVDSLGNKSKLSNTSVVASTNMNLVNYIGPSQLFKSEQYNYYLLKENQWIEIFNAIEQKNLGYFGVPSYCEDRNGNYWLCTDKGIYQVNIRKNQFEHLFSNALFNQIGNAPVRNIYVDQHRQGEKQILAMVNSQLRIKEKEERAFVDINGSTLLKKKDWLYAGGFPMSKYNLVSGKTMKYTYEIIGDVWSMADYSDSLILLGGSSGIIVFNTQSNVSRLVTYAQKNIPSPVNVYRITKTKSKGWIAVAENGIYLINDHTVIYNYYGKEQQLTDFRLPFTGIFDLYEDKEGVAWLAMNGDGLIRWNWNASHPIASENFKKFTIENGLSDNILYRIEEDNNKNFWISSYSGLVKFNKDNYSTRIYRTKDGLVNTEFNRISSFKDEDGIIYFGGQNGIDAFDPATMNQDSKESSVPFQLVGLSKFSSAKDTLVEISKELKTQNEIIMNVGDKFLTISYSLLDFQNRPHRYAYRIDGIDKDWNYLNENVIRISSLPYGKFKLRIKAQLESGNWNEQEILIPIHVLKPFYLESMFIVFASLLFVLFVYLIILYRTRKFKKDSLILEQKVQQRTESLNKALSEKELLLTEIHHRVKNNLQVISGLLELRKSGIEDEKGMAAFNESQSGIMSIAMIHELLYQNENVGKLEFNVILNNIISNVAQLFGREDRKIIFEILPNDFVFNINTTVTLGLIMNELLTNAYKYLPAHQKNKVVVSVMKLNKNSFQLIFHDNGPGLPSDIDFDALETIGFSIIKSLVKQLHGSLAYEYEQGSKFVIDFEDNG